MERATAARTGAGNRNVAIVGCGWMGGEIARQLIKKGIRWPSEITATRRSYAELVRLSESLGVNVSTDNLKAAAEARTVILAVRPQQMRGVLNEIRPAVKPEHVVVPVAVGLDAGFYEALLPGARVVRVMPNPFVGRSLGLVALSRGSHCDDAAVLEVRGLLEPLCEALVEVPDAEMHAFATLASSSSAFLYYFFDAFVKHAGENGFPSDLARRIVLASARAASQHALETTGEFAELISYACTPGGMTAEGIRHLDANAVATSIQEALKRTTARSRQIGKEAMREASA